MYITNNIFSLDAPVNEDDDYSFGDVIEDKSMGPDEALLAKSLTQSIDDIMKMYSEREREIIRLRYGLHDTKPLSLKEIGELYGLSKERIRQLENSAIQKLRNFSNELRQNEKVYMKKYQELNSSDLINSEIENQNDFQTQITTTKTNSNKSIFEQRKKDLDKILKSI